MRTPIILLLITLIICNISTDAYAKSCKNYINLHTRETLLRQCMAEKSKGRSPSKYSQLSLMQKCWESSTAHAFEKVCFNHKGNPVYERRK